LGVLDIHRLRHTMAGYFPLEPAVHLAEILLGQKLLSKSHAKEGRVNGMLAFLLHRPTQLSLNDRGDYLHIPRVLKTGFL
jgi:hypothetical protein